MKKELLCGLALFAGLSPQAFAATGSAYDGLEFILVLAGLLFLLAGFLWGIDYLNKNGKALAHRVKAFIKKKKVKNAACDSRMSDYPSIL
jgi:hypothetical protein